MFENVRRDLERAGNDPMRRGALKLLRILLHPGTQAVLSYRFAHWVLAQPKALRVFLKPISWIPQAIMTHFYSIMLPPGADIGPGLVIHNWLGGISLPRCRIGRDVTVVGGPVLWDFETREIGDEVTIGAGMKAVGKITIGNRVRIAPNAVIISSVPDDAIVFGNPSRIIPGGARWTREQGSEPG